LFLPERRVIRSLAVMLSRFFPWASALVIAKPDTFVRWHRAGFRLFWRRKSRHAGSPPLPKNLCAHIMVMAHENPGWGEGRIANELSLKLGLFVDSRTFGKYLKQRGSPRQPSPQRWATFVHHHASDIVALPPASRTVDGI
jgi:putative transposase